MIPKVLHVVWPTFPASSSSTSTPRPFSRLISNLNWIQNAPYSFMSFYLPRTLPSQPCRLGELLLTHDTHIRSPLLAVNHPPLLPPQPVWVTSSFSYSVLLINRLRSKTTVHRTGCFFISFPLNCRSHSQHLGNTGNEYRKTQFLTSSSLYFFRKTPTKSANVGQAHRKVVKMLLMGRPVCWVSVHRSRQTFTKDSGTSVATKSQFQRFFCWLRGTKRPWGVDRARFVTYWLEDIRHINSFCLALVLFYGTAPCEGAQTMSTDV